MTFGERKQLAKNLTRYGVYMTAKQVCGRLSRLRRPPALASYPAVTVFLTSCNNRYPLELTLRTLAECTRYPNYRILVADNLSTDGSAVVLDRLAKELPLTVLSERKPQSDWYDQIYRTVDTPYWIGVHEDLVFFGHDWLTDLVATMERDPDVWLVEGEWFPPKLSFVEPVAKETIDLHESLTTWLFCVRTALRDQLPDVRFSFYKERNPDTPNTQCWDIGGKLLRDMTNAGLRYEVMPRWFRLKWHHLANLSWVDQHDTGNVHSRFKGIQRADAQRRVLRRWPEPALASPRPLRSRA